LRVHAKPNWATANQNSSKSNAMIVTVRGATGMYTEMKEPFLFTIALPATTFHVLSDELENQME
jgi:hypothetical protein